MKGAWYAAALPLSKKFPELAEMLGDKVVQAEQTPEQMIAAMQAWVGATGQ